MNTCRISLKTLVLESECVSKCGSERAAHCLSRPAHHHFSTCIELSGLCDAEKVYTETRVYHTKLHGLSMFAVKAKIYGMIYNQSSSIAFDETSSYWSAPKKRLISRLFIGHHTVVWFPLVSIS